MSKNHWFKAFIIALSFSSLGSSVLAYQADHHPTIHLYAAREGHIGDSGCVAWQDSCLVYLNKGQPLVFNDYSYSVAKDSTPAITLNLSQTDAGALNELIQKHHSPKLALVVQGVLVSAPTLKADHLGPTVSLTFEGIKARDEMAKALSSQKM